MFDAVIVGGGPAGLNAALVLGRVGRRVLLGDSGQPRNQRSEAVHGFLSRDGIEPAELRRTARAELAQYPSVQTRETAIQSANPIEEGFEVRTDDGQAVHARRLLLASGVIDQLPDIDGLAALWGRGVFHCPYCHGWEVRGQQVMVLGGDEHAAHLALSLARLDCDVLLFANGPFQAGEQARAALTRHHVPVCEDLVLKVEPAPAGRVHLRLAPGWMLERRALFTHPRTRQRSDLGAHLSCAVLDDGAIAVNELGQTSVPGVYAAGDMCRTPAMPTPAAQVIMAAAQGARAAVVIDQDLLLSDPAQLSSPNADDALADRDALRRASHPRAN